MVCPKFETEFLGKLWNSNVFSAQKQVVSKKKKKKKKKKKRSSPKLSLIFWPKSEVQTIFQPKNKWSPKQKKRSTPKLSLIFRPKSEIETLFHNESRHLHHNFGIQFPLGGTVFNFSPKIGLKGNKNVRFCILHKPIGGARAPPWLRYWFGSMLKKNNQLLAQSNSTL